MTLDEHVLRDVEAARTRLEVLEDQAYEARASFHAAIRRLHSTGGSMREIATALGMSHQRIHQIERESESHTGMNVEDRSGNRNLCSFEHQHQRHRVSDLHRGVPIRIAATDTQLAEPHRDASGQALNAALDRDRASRPAAAFLNHVCQSIKQPFAD